ncbi:DJ-1/PfpI family protein [Acidovorax sp. NCPPB 4044]|uniref:DJ-1/PfpI family protein n=1 Tax=Acidovorax sp. NCPPB 4044 TaxID=2940490 RepID=UPI002302F655|nr:DJ-1/PfpI family protein [Acidovorax sp. NCPPB 4044]MDA8521725.1 DJ-1/PfpI family protein [Acidovorax sp. NCPPB 4044]
MTVRPTGLARHTPPATWRVAILAFDDVEALDLAGPYEVFTTAARMHARQALSSSPPLFDVRCVARDAGPSAVVRARAGLRIVPDAAFADAGVPDVLIVPGGVVDGALACPATLAWIARAASDAWVTASVCTGAFLLAAAGVVQDGPVTTHWEDVDDLRRSFPRLDVRTGVRWVDHDGNGTLFSSAGISAGIDLSLHLVERLAGRALAERTARQMDTPWNPDPRTAPQP